MALIDSMNLRQSTANTLRAGKSVAQEEVGRVCDAQGCTTRLSRYNPATSCCQHEGWAAPPQTRTGAGS